MQTLPVSPSAIQNYNGIQSEEISEKVGDHLIINPKDRELDGKDFLKIFTFQLANQNPFEPLSSGEMMEQFSGLSSLRLSESLENFTKYQNNAMGGAYLGKTVAIETLDAQGRPKLVSGVVSAISHLGSDRCKLTVNGEQYSAADVVKVEVGRESLSPVYDYLGKHVVIHEMDPQTMKASVVEGTVSALVGMQSDKVRVVVKGKEYDPLHIKVIRLSESPPNTA